MDKIELQLVDYLNDNPKMIKDSLDASFLYYEYIKVLEVSMDNDMKGFDITVETYPGGRSLSWFPTPMKFLRKMKLNDINERK